tara:strand:+ start:332 stop:502 length:171 start_codon:yes stop_codon:yes gene_type:complete
LGGVTLLRKWAFPFYQKGITMPTVKGKKYPYTTAGRKAAVAAARKPKGKRMGVKRR